MGIIFEKAFGKVGIDFYLGYSPEREDQGNPLSNFDDVPKINLANIFSDKIEEVFNLLTK